MKYIALLFFVVVSLLCTGCTINHPTAVLSPWESLQYIITGEKKDFPDIHNESIIKAAPKDKYILLSWTTYLYTYALPHEVHIYGSLIDPNIKFNGKQIDAQVSFSWENVATIQSGILYYDNVRIQLPKDLIGRWYFNMYNPAYQLTTSNKQYANNIDHRLVFSDKFVPTPEDYTNKTTKKFIVFIYNGLNRTNHEKWNFCWESNKFRGVWANISKIFTKTIYQKESIPVCVIYRENEDYELKTTELSKHTLDFDLPNSDIWYTIMLLNYSQQEAKQVFDSLDIIE